MSFAKLAVIAAALLTSVQAQAATLFYSMTGDYTANWTMSSNPVPINVQLGQIFRVQGVSGTFEGIAGNTATLIFYSSAEFGGIGIEDDNGPLAVDTTGPQLYAGLESMPSMLTGTFALLNESGLPVYTLVVTNLSAVPEPTSWAMMLTGFGLAGTAIRRRKVAVRAIYA